MELPRSIWEGSFTLFGVEVRCHVLDDGQRMVETDSAERLFGAMASIAAMPSNEEGERSAVEEFTQWIKGGLVT